MIIKRRKARIIKIGKVPIGGNHPIAVQSMAKTRTRNIAATVGQIKGLEIAGCEIVRVAVADKADAEAIKKIKREIAIPLVADIHFNWRLALQAIDSGADKVRLNPGNISKESEIREVIRAAKSARIPIRIGVNSGSVRPVDSRQAAMPKQLVACSLDYIKLFEKQGFYDIVVSLKGSNVFDTVEAYRGIAGLCDYPLHLGVTATGLAPEGAIKSSVACGILLAQGLGDTLRVSLTDDPLQEVAAAKAILESLGLRKSGYEIISCPTCGRCEVDLISMVNDLEDKLTTSAVGGSAFGGNDQRLTTRPLKVAVMGCVVNGPGEAKQADIGIAFGKGSGLFFKGGKPIRKIPVNKCLDEIAKEIRKDSV